MTAKAPLDFHKGFHDVDATGQAGAFDSFLNAIYRSPVWQEARVQRYDMAGIKLGEHVLDAGCGPGFSLADHAAAVGPQGQLTGLDYSQDLLSLAQERAKGLKPAPRLQQGDLHALPFADESFDVMWSERVWMYLARPREAIAQAFRVLKPGGRLAIGEIDFTSVWSISRDDTVRQLAQDRTMASTGDPKLVRALAGYCLEAGFVSVKAEPSLTVGRDFAFTERAGNLPWHLDRMVEDGTLTRQYADHWLATQRQLSADGEYTSWALVMNIVARKKG